MVRYGKHLENPSPSSAEPRWTKSPCLWRKVSRRKTMFSLKKETRQNTPLLRNSQADCSHTASSPVWASSSKTWPLVTQGPTGAFTQSLTRRLVSWFIREALDLCSWWWQVSLINAYNLLNPSVLTLQLFYHSTWQKFLLSAKSTIMYVLLMHCNNLLQG